MKQSTVRLVLTICGAPLVLAFLAFILIRIDQPGVHAQDAGTNDPLAEIRQNFSEAVVGILEQDKTTPVPKPVEYIPEFAPFPHVALYGGMNSSGWPFVGSLAKDGTCSNNASLHCAVATDCGSVSYTCTNPNTRPPDTTPLNADVIAAYAKQQLSILPITPLADGRTDIIPAIKAINPKTKIFGYAVGQITWCPYDQFGNIGYPVGYYYRDFYLGVTGGDPSCTNSSSRFLWAQDGDPWDGANVNLAYRVSDGNGGYTYPVAEATADAMYDHANPSNGFDGIFIDIFCSGIRWGEYPGNIIDYVRAGYGTDNNDPATLALFDAGWAAGQQAGMNELRARAIADGHPNYPLVANCGQSPNGSFAVFNGWMREGYPFQNGGTFNSNMLTYPWGYLHQDYLFQSPTYNQIFTAAAPSTAPYSSLNQQKQRFGLGSATLGNGWHAFEDGVATAELNDYEFWWFDEYGVNTLVPQSDPNYGRAMNGQQYTGWLGQPLNDAYQYILPNVNPDIIPVNTFDQDLSQIELATFNSAQATITRETTDTAVGTGDVKVHITQTGTDNSSVVLNSNVFTTTSGTYYSLTYWAKASAARGISVLIDGAGTSMPVTTEWKKYQVTLKALSTGNAVYQLQLSQTTGDIWFDDFKIQAGVGNVWRRDFDKGTVLVNPYTTTLSVGLEKSFKKILGTVSPSVNDGSTVSTVTLTPNTGYGIGDALFLLSIDVTPPDPVSNLITQ